MTDAQFYNSFVFQKYEFNKYHTTDNTAGAPRHFFAQLICGHAKLQCASYSVELSAGDVFYIPNGIRYRSHWYPENGIISFYSIGFTHLPSNVDYMMQKIEGAGVYFEELSADITVSADSIARLYGFFANVKDKMKPQRNTSQGSTVLRAIEYIQQHPDASACEIAANIGISESGLYGIFKKSLGKTPLEIKRKALIERAEELLLTTDLPIEKISDILGFSSSSYFRKVLFKMTGKSPSYIRKNRL